MFVKNESQLLTVAAKQSIDQLLSDSSKRGLVTKQEVIAQALDYAREVPRKIRAQQSYVRMIEDAMSSVDDKILAGRWNYIRTAANDPFIISDAPVVTWERMPDGEFSLGMGFHRANVEVLLPISPLGCLHILPDVERTRPTLQPSVLEINTAQAAFATCYCYSHIQSNFIDQIVKENLGAAELGVKGFTVWHRNYATAIYDIMMNNGRWVEPKRLRTGSNGLPSQISPSPKRNHW